LSAAGGRCPTCGAEQPTEAPRSVGAPIGTAPLSPPRPARLAGPTRNARPKALPWVVLGVGLAAIGALFALVSRHTEAPELAPHAVTSVAATAAPPSVDPNDFGIQDPSAVDPMEILGRAKTRALVWSKDAQLASIRVEPVLNAKVNLKAGGAIEFWFAKPNGENFGSGARTSGKRLHISVTSAGTSVDETAAVQGRAALEPSCPLDEAVRKAVAVGVPSTTPVSVSYDVSDKYKKAVWRIAPSGSDGPARTVDGWTCAILVR